MSSSVVHDTKRVPYLWCYATPLLCNNKTAGLILFTTTL